MDSKPFNKSDERFLEGVLRYPVVQSNVLYRRSVPVIAITPWGPRARRGAGMGSTKNWPPSWAGANTDVLLHTRLYAEGEVLARHTDRPACEISVTVSVKIPKGMGPSVIYLKPPGLPETHVEMHEGDACIYAGLEVEHWREPFPSDGYIQLFLHFIDRHGKNFPQCAYDERERLGGSRQ